MDLHTFNEMLWWEANDGWITGVQDALRGGAEINHLDVLGETALMTASYRGHDDIVKYLIEQGADIHLRSKHGSTALVLAGFRAIPEIIQYLLDAGADVNAVDHDGNSVLHHLCKRSDNHFYPHQIQGLRLLLSKGADKTLQNQSGESPLMIAQKKLGDQHQITQSMEKN